MISSAQRRLLLLTATFALSLLSCGREVTGPENGFNYGRAKFGAVSLDPQMPSLLASLEGASDVVPFERVRVVLRREDGSISVDTIVNFPVGADSIALSLLVPLPLDTPEEGLPLSLTMAYMNAAGDTVFRGGPVSVIAPPVGSSGAQQPITIPIVYDGIGKDAARVAIAPKTSTQVAGTSSTFTATAFDGSNAPIANTPIIYYTLDSSRASIPAAGTGQVTWLANRGVARIVASLPNGARADTAFVSVSLPASKLVVQSGNAQSGVVSSALAQPIVLRTLASDDVPVAGVVVTFAVSSGNGTLSALTDTSDANGVVSTNWTLGAALGAQTISVTSPGLTGSPTTITATATPGTPAQVAFTQVVTAATSGTVLAPPVLVAVQDVAGNVVTDFTGAVSLELTATSSGPLKGTTTVNAVAGIASFSNLSFDVAGPYNLIAVLDSTARDTSATITITPGAGAVLEFVAQPIGAVAGVPFVPPVTVIAKDAQGNIATGFTGTVTLALQNPAGATLGGSLSVAAVNGLATFTGLTVDKVGTSYALTASSGTLTSATSATFGIVPALPAVMVVISGDAQTAPASTTLPASVVVEVRDAFQNPIAGVTVNFTALVGGGSPVPASAVTDALGRAATTWTLGSAVGAQSLRAIVPANPAATVDIAATATIGAPAVVVFTQLPASQQVAGQPFVPQVIVEVRDISGNVVTNFNGNVSLGLDSNPSGASLLGTLNVNAVNGIATFPGMFLELAGVGYTLKATVDTLPAGISSAFDVVNATPSLVVPVAGDGQSGTVGTLLADSLTVRVTDGFGNKAPDVEVIFTPAAGAGVAVPNVVTTNALGEATTAWTIGAAAGTQTLTAAIAGGANYVFSATGTVGAPTAIAITAGDGQTGGAGTAVANPIVAKVTDSFGNPVAGVLVSFTVQSGGGSVSPTSALTDALGQAQTVPTLGGALGTQTVVASIDGGLTAAATTTIIAGPVANFGIVAGNNQTGAAGAVVTDTLRVRVSDIFGNPVVNHRTDWSLQPGASSIADTIVFTDANGIASNTAVYGAVTGPGILANVSTAGIGSTVSFEVIVTAAVAQSFEFTSAPTGGIAGGVIAGIVVAARDAFNNAGASFDSVTIVVDSGPAGAVLTGTTTRAAIAGTASFDDLSLDRAGSYKLRAQRGGITTAVTAPFTITAGVASTLSLDSGDSQVATAGSAYALPMRVLVTDDFGNPVAGAKVAWSGIAVTVGADTTLSDANGIAEVVATAETAVGIGTVTATLVAAPAQFVVFDVAIDAGTPSAIVAEVQPVDGTAGVVLNGFAVRANDAFGNLATGFVGPVTLTAQLTNGTPVAVIVQGDSVDAVGGIATFTGTRIDVAGTYQLVANFGALGTLVLDSIIVSPAGPSDLLLVDGDAQTGAVTQTLGAPLRVRVTDSFGNGVAGVNVNWGVTSGVAQFSDTVTVTDASGLAQTSVILGSASGTVTIGAFAAGLNGSPVGFTATATAGAAFGLIVESGDLQTAAAGAPFAQPFVVRVVDAFGNGVSGVDVTFGSIDGVSVFSDTVVTSDATGLASTTATAATTAGSALITANAPGVSPASFGVTITAGVASELFYQSIALVGTAGVVYDPIVIVARDAFGNVATDFADSVTISIRIGANGATLAGTVTRAPVAGVITFDDLVFTTLSSYQLQVVGGPLTGNSPGIQVNAAAAAAIASDGLPERTVAATAVAPPLFAKVTDAFGNPVAGETVTWTVASGAITLSAPTSVTDATGVASVEVTAGTTAGLASATASSGTLVGSPVTYPITITNGPGTQLTMEIGPVGDVVGTTLAPFTVAVRDANGNVATDFVGNVTIAVDSGPSAVITGTATVAVSTGAATFDAVTFETAGTYRLRFTSAGLSDAVSADFVMVAGAAANLTLLDGDAQSDTVALPLDLPLRVRVTDAFGNGVAGQAVAWAPIGAGTVALDTTATDASGIAQVGFTLGTLSGATTMQASVIGLTGSPAVFTATAIPGDVTALAVTSPADTVVAGNVGAPITVEARDQYGNVVTWFTGNVDVVINDAPSGTFLAGTTTQTAVAGIATFGDLAYQAAGSWFVDFVSGAVTVGHSVEVIAGAAANVVIASGDAQTGIVTLPLPLPLQVRVTDANNNPIVGDTVVFSVTQGGGTLSSLTALDSAITNSSGFAQTTWTLGSDTTVTHVVQANRTGFATLTFTATPLPLVANRTWTGDVDSDPANSANWQGGLIPTATDSVLVPTGRPNYPSFPTVTAYKRLTVESGATVTVPTARLEIDGSLSVLGSGTITTPSTGEVALINGTGGTVRGNIGRLVIDAGTYTATGPLTLGSLSVSSTLAVNGQTVDIAGNLDLNPNATLAMNTGAADLVTVNGNATFGNFAGGSLLTGTLTVRGDFTAGDGFSPDAGHTVVLDGAGNQTVALGVADTSYTASCASSCFGTLTSPKATGGLIFATSVKAIGAITISGDTLGAAGHTIIGVTGTTLQSAVTTAGSVGYTNSLQVGSIFIADTLVAFGGNGSTPLATFGVIPSVVTGAYSLGTNHPGSLTISGVLDIDGPDARSNDNLRTIGTGRIRMTDTNDSLSVAGAFFEGITDSTFLTAGVLDVRADFVQIGSGVTTYAAQSGHRLRFSAPTATINLTSPELNPIGSLSVTDGTTLSVDGIGVLIAGTAVLEGTTAAATSATAEALILGGLVDSVGNRWTTVSTRFQGAAVAQIPVRISSDVIFAGPFTLADSLIVTGSTRVTTAAGSLALNGRTLRTGSFGTDDGGQLLMVNPTDSLFSAGNVTFNGAGGFINDGYISVGAGFFQTDNGGSFSAGPLHTVAFTGTGGPPSITAANTFTGTVFGTIRLASGTGTTLALVTDVQANRLESTPGDSYTITSAGGSRLVTFGTSASNLTFENIRWELSGSAPATVANIAFGAMDPTVTQLLVAANGGTVSFPGLSFATTPTSGQYLYVQDNATADNDTLIVDVAGVSPQFHNGKITAFPGSKIINWDAFAALNWTGAIDQNWHNTGNWAEGVLPSALDSVIVSELGLPPIISVAPVQVRSLISSNGLAIQANDTLTVSRRLKVNGITGMLCGPTSAVILESASDSVTVDGNFDCLVIARAGMTRLAGLTQVDSMRVEGSAYVNPGGFTFNVAGDFSTTGNASLFMTDAAGTVEIAGTASFLGTTIPGGMTAGTLTLLGDFIQVGNANAFQADAGHLTRFAGNVDQAVVFTNPDSSASGSHFGSLSIESTEAGVDVLLASDVFINGDLTASNGTQRSFSSALGTGAVITSRGAFVDIDLNLDRVRWRIAEGNNLGSVINTVRFTNQPESVTQLSIAKNSGSVQLSGFQFDTLPAVTTYLAVVDPTGAGDGTFTVDMLSPSPAFHGGRVNIDPSALLTGWSEFASFIWTGAQGTNWNLPGNWSDNLVPNASSVVTIPDVAFQPVTSTPVSVRQLTLVGTGTTLSLSDTLFISEALHTGVSTSVSCSLLGRVRFVPTDTATVRGTIGCPIDVLSGVVAQSGNTDITGVVKVDSVGRLAIREHDMVLASGSTFATATNGTLSLDDPSGSLTINGAATFGGGATTGLLTSGQIIFNGDVTQSGGDPAALDISTSVGTIFSPSASSLVSFADPASSGLGTTVVTSGTMSILNATTVRGPFDVQTGATVDGEFGRLTVNGDLTGNGALIVKTASFTGNWARFGALQPDTVIFAGVNQVMASTYSGPAIGWKSVVVEGTARATTSGGVLDTLNIGGSLLVRGATARLTFDNTETPGDSLIAFVFSSLRTRDGGTIEMNEPGVAVRVGGTGDFQGGDQAGLLTQGRLTLEAAFVNTVPNAYVASNSHTTAIGGCTLCDGIQVNVTGGSPRFGSLVMQNGSNASVSSDIEADTLRMQGGNVIFPNAGSTLRVNFDLTSGPTPTLTVSRLSIGEFINFDGTWGVDTLIMTGAAVTLPARDNSGDQIPYNDVVIEGEITTSMLNGDTLTVGGGMTVRGNGRLRFNDGIDGDIVRMGSLRTQGNGIIQMFDANTMVRVLGPAVFAGGNTDTQLLAGTLEFHGDFTQDGTNSPSSFGASGDHLSRFVIGTTVPVIGFANAGGAITDSHFSTWELLGDAGTVARLATDVYATKQIVHTGVTPIELGSTDIPKRIYVTGANLSDVTFRAVSMQMDGSASPLNNLNNLSFVDQDPATDQLTIIRDGADGVVQLVNPVFSTPPTTGLYLVLQDNVADASFLTVNVTNPFPAFHSNKITLVGDAVLTGWPTNGPGIWTGSFDGDFGIPANWQSGVVPSATDSIFVDDGALNTLTITSPVTVGAISIVGGQIALQDTLTVTGTMSLGAGAAFCSLNGALRVAYPGVDSVAFSMNSSQCNAYVSDGRVYLDQTTNVVNLFVEQDATLDLNGQSLNTVGDLIFTQTARLVMTESSDTVRVGSQARFQGGDETGLLTAGALVVSGSFLQGGATTSFASSGSLHVFLGDSTNVGLPQYTIDFNDPVTSPINQLTIFDNRLAFGPVNVSGELRMGNGSALTGLATTALGGFRLAGSAALTVDRLAVAGPLFLAGTFTPDTVDFLGAGPVLQEIPAANQTESQIIYGTIRVLADSARMRGTVTYQITNGIEVGGNALLVVGNALVPGNPVTVAADAADLVLTGNGRLRQLSDGEIRVASASFNGGDLDGLLTRGDLVVHGNFTQQQNGAIGSTFIGTEQHRVVLDGTGTMQMENPAVARFADLVLTGEVTLTLLSDITVDSALVKTTVPTSENVTIQSDQLVTSGPRTITVGGGTSFPSGTGTRTTLRNVALRLDGDASAGGGSVALNDLTFQDMNPAVTYLDIQLANYAITFDGMDFATAVTTGKYIDIVNAGNTITITNSTPAVGCINAPEGCVGPRFEPSAPEINTWQGLTNDWTQAANWSLGTVPSSWTDVVIPVTSSDPVLGLDDVVRNLTVQSGATLTIVGATLNVNGTALDVSGAIAQGGSSVLALHPPGAPATISGGGTIATALTIDTPSSGSETTVTLTAPLVVNNNLNISANTLVLGGQTLKVGDLFTTSTGRLEMSVFGDSLDANNVSFAGGSTDGLLSAGTLVVRFNFFQGGSTTAFSANPAHTTVLAGGAVQQVTFANPTDADSHFGTLRYLGSFGDSLILNSDVIGVGPLQAKGNRVVASSNVAGTNRILRVDGFDNSLSGQNYFANVSLYARDSWGLNFTSSLFFSNMSLNVPQLWLLGDGGTVNIAAATFTPLGPSDPGVYVLATDANLDGNFFTVNMPFRSPEGHGGKVQFDNGAVLTGWDALALYTFTGAVNGDFTNVANWDVGVLPTTTSNVLVDNLSSGNALVINSPVTVKRLTTASGSLLALQDTLYTTGVQGGFDVVSGATTCSANGVFVVNDPSAGPTWLRANVPGCDVILRQGNVNLGNGFLPAADTTNLRSLLMEGGFFNVAKTVNVAGDLTMAGGGVLFMGGATDSLVVQGEASFRGNQAWLSGGNLVVRGNLDVGASAPAQFRMDSPSHLTLGNPLQPLSTRTISIDAGSQMYVDSLTIEDGTATVTGQLNVRRRLRQITSNTNILNGETIVLGSKADDIVGTLTTDAGSILTVDRFELFGNITSAGDFSPDTADFVGTSVSDNFGYQKIRAANDEDGNYGYKRVRVFDNATMDQVTNVVPIAYTIAEALEVRNGTLTIGNGALVDSVFVNMGSADLIVDGVNASLFMAHPARVTVDSAHFQGGITSQLSFGRLVARSVVAAQQGAQNITLVASDPHVLDLYGEGWLSMNDYANNPLSTVRLTGGAVTNLDTYLRITGSLGRVADGDGLVTLRAGTIPGFPQFIVTPSTDFGPTNSGLALRNVSLSLQASYPEPGGSAILNNVTFTQMDPTAIYLQALWSGVATATWNNINFNTPVSGGGRYFEFATGDPGSTITFTNTSPAEGCFLTVCTPGDFTPVPATLIQWTGAVDNQWNTAANWDLARVPVATDSVVINVAVSDTVNVNTTTTVSSLVVGETGSVLLNNAFAGSLTVNRHGSIGAGSTLRIVSSNFGGAANVAVAGTLEWEGGTMFGSGTTTVATGAVATIGFAENVTLNARKLTIGGTATVGEFGIFGANVPTVETLVGGELTYAAPQSIGVGGVISLVNAGTMRFSPAGNLITVEATIANTGTIEVLSGTLDLQNTVTHTGGLVSVAGSATLISRGNTFASAAIAIDDFGTMTLQSGGIGADAGNHIFTSTSNITGLGTVRVNSADTTRFQGGLNIDSLTVLNGNTWFESADTMVVNNGAYLGGGFFRGNGVLRYNGNFVLNSGNIVGTGTMHVAPTGFLDLRGMTGWFVDVEGTARWGDYDMTFGQDTLNGVPYASMRVRTGAVLDIQHGVTTPRELFGRGATTGQVSTIEVESGATLRKTVGSGISNIRPRILLSGVIDVLNGSINVQGSCSVTGGTKTGPGALTGNTSPTNGCVIP